MTVTVTIASVVITFKTEENIFAVPFGLLEVGGPDGVVAIPGPNQVAVITKNVWRSLAGAVHFAGRVRKASKRRNEEVALFHIICGRDCDIESRRGQVRTTLELPVCGAETK